MYHVKPKLSDVVGDTKWCSDVLANYSISLEIDEELHREKSTFQDIFIFKSKSFGKVLVLDGVIQLTERDEFAYQEMMAHVPLFCHKCPKKVLVVGGGDGGVIREVLKHPDVENVILCEIDERVIELSKIYFPNMASCLDDPRVTVHVGDGMAYVAEHKSSFDVIITDSSDPVGPGIGLFQPKYYRDLKAALRSGGIVCSQGENIWIDLELIQTVVRNARDIYKSVAYASIYLPTYTCGQIGIVVCSDDEIDLTSPTRTITENQVADMKLRYYNSDLHKGAFILPQFVKQALAADAVK